MRTRALGLLAALSLVGALPVVDAPAKTPVRAVAAKSCGSGYVHAYIGPRGHKAQKCLRAGEFCAHRYNRQYHRYGYNCTRYYRNVHRYRLTHR